MVLSGNVLELSARVEYALLALLELATCYQHKEPVKITEITAHQAIPDRYLEQILTNLRRSGIVQSQRGARGGYMLARDPWQITLLEIVKSVEGDSLQKKTPKASTVEKNLVHEVWQQARTASRSVLERYTLEDLYRKRQDYMQVNPMYHI
jgi:Rrf2 family protein